MVLEGPLFMPQNPSEEGEEEEEKAEGAASSDVYP